VPWSAAGIASVTQAFWLGGGAINPGALYGIIAAYGVSAVSWGGIAFLTKRIRRWRKNKRLAGKAKEKEDARMAEWLEVNGAPYPWKKKAARNGKDFYYNVEAKGESHWEAPEESGLPDLPTPWELRWSDTNGRYTFWNPKEKKHTLERPTE